MRQEYLMEEIESLRRRVAELEETQVRLTNTERALLESEERFRLLYENTPLGYQSLDQNGYLVEVNKAWLDTLGYSREEVIGKWFGDFLAPEFVDHFRRNFPKFKAAGEIHWVEFDMLKKDASRIAVAFDGQIGRDQWGRFRQTHCILHDLTELRRSRQELEQSQERLSRALDGANLGIWDWDLTTGKAVWTQRTLGMLGYQEDDLEPNLKTWKRLVHPEDWPKVSENLNLHMQGILQTFEVEYRIMNKSGGWQWLHGRGKAIEFDAAGRPTRMTGIVVDITDRKKTEETLKNSEARYRFLTEHGSDLIWTLDLNLRTTFVTPSVEKVLGFTPEERMLQEIEDQLTPESLEYARQRLIDELSIEREQGIQEGKSVLVELDYYHKNGSIVCLQTAVTFIRDDNGTPVGLHGISRDITELKHSQEALRDSEERYRLLSEHSLTGVLIHQDGVYVYVNKRFAEMTGYSVDELIGRDFLNIVHPEDRDMVRDRATKRSSGEAVPPIYEFRLLHKSGDTIWAQIMAARIRHRGRVAIMANMLDITQRKKSEEALRKINDELQAVVHASPVSIVAFDQDSIVKLWNPASEEIFGWSATEATGKFLPFIPEDKMEEHIGIRELAFRGERLTGIEARRKRKDGSSIDVSGSTAPLHDSEGRIAGVMAVFMDVTERKRAREALRESEERYRQITENSLTGIFVYQDGRSVYANRRLAEMVGYTPEEVLSVPFLETIHPDDRNMVKERAKARLAGQPVPNHYELRLLHKDGSTVWSEVLSHRIDYQGRPAILGNVANVTQSRILEEQLRQAQKMEAVGTLAGGIAHDFNNLLHIISGHAELLDMELAERKLNFRELDAIRQSAQRGADLVKQILTFSRRIDAKFESIDLNEKVRSTERLLYRTIPRMIDIELRLEEGLYRVRADSTQIEQMLINLAVNAKDAMPEGGSLVIETRNVNLDEHYCRSHAEIVPGQYVLFKISDTGHGMEEDVRQHIFEPFFTTKGLADGTGLGLATAFGIVKMHGGHITCESEVGRGTTFSIYFPAAEAVKPDREEQEEVSAVAGGTEKILVVDDEPMINDLAKKILEKSGYSVLTAGSGKEGMEVYAQHKSEISLVILDLIMPEMGGKQCLEGLLALNPSVKVIIASGFSADGPTKDALSAGAKRFVNKPYDIRQVREVVRAVLDED